MTLSVQFVVIAPIEYLHNPAEDVDWATLWEIVAPSMPQLQSITFTSYSSANELDQGASRPIGCGNGNRRKEGPGPLGLNMGQ